MWDDFLRLLEGQIVNLPAPKNHYSRDIRVDMDTPIFATRKAEITYSGPYNARDSLENAMMANWWKVYNFSHVITPCDAKDIPP